MKIIVGLGNPGTKYAGTRHNVGFSVIVALADKYHISMNEAKHKAIIGKGVIEGQKVLLVMPQTFMNLSGESVGPIVNYYKVDPEDDVIVVYDDIYLDVGRLRIREKGSAGGHNGMKDIIKHLGTEAFARIRVGVGEKPKQMDLADYVLSRFSTEEQVDIRKGVDHAVEAVALMVNDGVMDAMSQFNKKLSE